MEAIGLLRSSETTFSAFAEALSLSKAAVTRCWSVGVVSGVELEGADRESDDDFMSTYKVSNYQLAPGVSCP